MIDDNSILLYAIAGIFIVIFVAIISAAISRAKKNKAELEITALRLAELRRKSYPSVEEEAEKIKLEVWLKRYENQTRPVIQPDNNAASSSDS